MNEERARRRSTGAVAAVAIVLALSLTSPGVGAQFSYTSGQNVSPAFEGWETNSDGTFNLLFGYINRNWLEELDVPVGAGNSISPGPADQGQPTHFQPRRNRFVFKVRVPADFGDQEMVWTLTTRAETEYAYGSLRPDYIIDDVVIASETGALGAGSSSAESRSNVAPIVTVVGEEVRSATVGEPMTLVATVTDDDLPRVRRAPPPSPEEPDSEEPPKLSSRQLRPPTRITVGKRLGLHLSWFVFRGGGEASFDPPQVKVWEDTRTGANSPWAPLWSPPEVPEDGRWEVRVTFDQPGTYILRARADDGGLYHDADVTVTVSAARTPE